MTTTLIGERTATIDAAQLAKALRAVTERTTPAATTVTVAITGRTVTVESIDDGYRTQTYRTYAVAKGTLVKVAPSAWRSVTFATAEANPDMTFAVSSAKQLAAVLKDCGKQAASFALTEHEVVVRTSIGAYEVATCERPQRMPEPPMTDRTEGHYGHAEWQDVALVATVASADQSRPVLTCVHLSENLATATATDSYRMTSITRKGDEQGTAKGGFLVPAEVVRWIGKRATDGVTVHAGERLIAIDAGNGVRAACKIVDGQFPNFVALKPELTSTRTIGRAAIVEFLRSTASVTKGSSIPVRLDEATISVIGVDGSAYTSTHNPLGTDHEPIGLAADSLADALLAVPETDELHYTNALRPVLLEGTRPSGAAVWHLLMPVRIS